MPYDPGISKRPQGVKPYYKAADQFNTATAAVDILFLQLREWGDG